MSSKEVILLKLTCHVVLLGSDFHLGFVDILDYSCAADGIKDSQSYRYICAKHNASRDPSPTLT